MFFYACLERAQKTFYRFFEKIFIGNSKENILELKKHLSEYDNTSDEAKDYFFDPSDIYIKQKSLQLYYSSIVISLYSFFEQSLLKLAEIPEKDKKNQN